MPCLVDKLKLNESQDRRRKLTEAQKVEIKERYAKGDISQRALALEYKVSRSLIQIVTNPAIAESRRLRVKKHWKDYSNRKALTDAVRNLRQYKKELHDRGEL